MEKQGEKENKKYVGSRGASMGMKTAGRGAEGGVCGGGGEDATYTPTSSPAQKRPVCTPYHARVLAR